MKKMNGLLFLSVLLGVSACCTTLKNVPISDGLKAELSGANARSAVFFDGHGNVVVTDKDGNVLKPCSFKPGKGQCRSFTSVAEVQEVRALTIIESKINPNCVAIVDGNGIAYEICW